MHDSILLFGATGDLAQRYLFPSLLHLLRDRLLPENFRVVAIGRTQHDDDGFRAWLRERIDEGDGYSGALDDLLSRIRYHALNLNDTEAMAAALAPYADRPAVSYLSTPPNLFEPACRGLKAAGLLEPPSRLVLEKPIGHDLASAREINATLRAALDESRIFRIDHYLGKAPVQNLLPLRFGNTLLEAVWDNRCIESVDIVVAETAGVDGREGYYADYGALRDMVQNHMLQLLALIAMEPPTALDADSIRDEKRKVLRALRPLTALSRPSSACVPVSTTGAGPACRSGSPPASACLRAPPRSWSTSSRSPTGCSIVPTAAAPPPTGCACACSRRRRSSSA